MTDSCDVLIVGARVAGSVLASHLGESGHRVIMVDRASFPSDTLSTHFFRGSAMCASLNRLGVLDEVMATGAPRLPQSFDYEGGAAEGSVTSFRDDSEIGFNLSVRRSVLDDILVRRAVREPNVQVRQQTSCKRLIREEGSITEAVLSDATGEQEIRARLVVGADGRNSTVARLVGAQAEVLEPPIRDVAYIYAEGFEWKLEAGDTGNEYSEMENEICYVFPSDNEITCIALSVGLDDFGDNWRKSTDFFAEHVDRHHGIAERYRSCRPISKLLRNSRDESWMRVPTGPGWALLGDASVHQDPWSGRGMDMASTHAEFLAEAVDEWLSGRATESVAFAQYHQRRNEHATPIFRETQDKGRDMRVKEIEAAAD